MKNRNDDTENPVSLTETPEDTEAELNDEVQPRPPVDPNNGLYTFLSLLIFAVLYIGYNYVTENIFVPYSKTVTEFTEEQSVLLLRETMTPLPEGAEICYARISAFTDNDMLHIRYSGITDVDALLESAGFEYSLSAEDERIPVFKGENADMDYVYGDVYASIDNGDLTLSVYEKEGVTFAEFSRSDYRSSVRSAFRNAVRVNYPDERIMRN